MRLDRAAYATLVALGVCFGLGDIGQTTQGDVVLLIAVRALLPLALALALAAAVREKRWPAFPPRIARATAAWLAVLLLSAALAPANRSDALATLARPAAGALLAWAVCSVCRAPGTRWARLAQALGVGGLAVALVGLAEASGMPTALDWLGALRDGAIPIGDVPRIASTLSHPNEAAMLLELSLPLLIAWLWTAPRPWHVALGMAVLANVLALVLTFSRAGIVAGVAGLAIMAGLRLARGQRRQLLPVAGAALAVPLALVWASMADPGLDRRLTAGVEQASPAQPSRLEFWSAAVRMLRDHPLLGVGPDNFRWRFTSYSGVAADNLGIHAHDQYLEALADSGLLGLLSLGWLLVGILGSAVHGLRGASSESAEWAWRAAVLASLSAWLLHALLDDFERFWPASVAFWLLVGLSLRVEDPQRAQRGQQTLGRVALAHEGGHARPQCVGALLGRGHARRQYTPKKPTSAGAQ